MAVAFGPSYLASGLTPKSKLLRNPEAKHGFVPTLGALRRLTLQEQAIMVEKTPLRYAPLKNRLCIVRDWFFSPKGGVLQITPKIASKM